MGTHFVDYEEVGVGDTRSPLAGNFVSTLEIDDGINGAPSEVDYGYYRNVNDVDNEICQLSGIICSKIVAATLDKE